jgi:hypothetical protein
LRSNSVHRRLGVRATVDGDGLAGAEAHHAGDRDNGRARAGGGATVVAPAVPTVAMTAVSRFAPVSILIVWPASKPATLATLILVAPAAKRPTGWWRLHRKSAQLLSVSSAVREAARAPDWCAGGRGSRSRGRAGRRHVAATLPRSGGGLVTLGGPWVDEAAVVEAVDDQAGGVPQHHAAGGDGDGAAEDKGALVARGLRTTGWARRSLVARGRDRGVAHNRVDRVAVGQGAVERDAGAERLDGLVAGVGKGRRRLEADPRSPIAEGKVGRMVELERGGQVEARARRYHPLVANVRLGEGRRKVDAGRRSGPRRRRR